jgi:serine/threonine-protein kinase
LRQTRGEVGRVHTAEAGSRIGRYRLIERVGCGRQADVWRALQVEPNVREVALKVLSDPGRDRRRLAQLRREAERGARLDSPALLPTYEFAEADGLAFMAMPLVVGCTLAKIIEHRRAWRMGNTLPDAHHLATLPESQYTCALVDVLARVARGVAAAHDARVVHRDIKPGNILLDYDAGVYLCDFGLGRDLDVATPRQLRDGAGSPLYMAPERLMKHPADEVRCDVYALGITLCEALTLAPPFKVPPSLKREHWPAFLATANLRRPSLLRPDLNPGLESTLVRATARNPAHRHPSALSLADDLERYLGEC